MRLAALIVVGVVICLQVVIGNINGVTSARSWHERQIQASRVITNINEAPNSMVERVLVANPYMCLTHDD